ncbi:hypothetical protein [Oceanobacter mangrovi]|uniref:hypothetical protein n=1 Tax=Oceanobacter mangrovi TaxID=2862510 RepID=UPI001C8DBB07|nr:hypothetical protein [Oceanobacter mangrovi]
MALLTRIRKNPWHFFLITITAPMIYGLIFPVVVVDVCVTLYQWICFPAYKIPQVRRSEYINIERGKLKYLNAFQKLNCVYCDYANGVFAYASEIAGRTEWYWCPIKHPQNAKRSHGHYDDFIAYGDGEDFPKKHKARRTACRACQEPCE